MDDMTCSLVSWGGGDSKDIFVLSHWITSSRYGGYLCWLAR